MIAWENRDLDAQQEFLDKLRDQLRVTAPEDRERIEKPLAKRLEIIEETKRERDALLAQKKELGKKGP